MSIQLTLVDRLRHVLAPTRTQVLGCFFVALALLASAQSRALLARIGISQSDLHATGSQFAPQLDDILRSSIAGQATLVTFWAVTGLVAYILCWAAYNMIVEARNEVTLRTSYTNRGRRNGAYEVLTVKAVACLGLALVLLSLWPGISFWFALSANAVSQLSLSGGLRVAIAVLGFAFQLYATLAFIQLAFTPWYRPEAFT